jgi:hypothetical protein
MLSLATGLEGRMYKQFDNTAYRTGLAGGAHHDLTVAESGAGSMR